MYKVKLEIYEGPLDLLLYLIRKNELDIYNIPIAEITRQYMEYVSLMEILDLDNAGEFLLMAATLLQMKSETMLPAGAIGEYDEPLLTREELVRQLLEYKKFKNAAVVLHHKEEAQRDIYVRSFPDPVIESFELRKFKVEATLFDLISAFNEILKAIPEEQVTELYKETVTVQQKIEEIMMMLANRKRMEFSSLFSAIYTKLEIIITFLAILELIKTRQIIARQSRLFGSIWIYKAKSKN